MFDRHEQRVRLYNQLQNLRSFSAIVGTLHQQPEAIITTITAVRSIVIKLITVLIALIITAIDA